MDKQEVIITTAKEIFLQVYPGHIDKDASKQDLSKIDEAFKAITKTISDAYSEAGKIR